MLREPRAEGATQIRAADLGRLLGLDRAPEVKTLRRKLSEMAGHGKGAALQAALGSTGGHQTPILTNGTDLTAAQVAYPMAARWRQDNYFKYAREHFALNALDSYADTPGDLGRLVPNPAKATAGAQISAARTQLVAA